MRIINTRSKHFVSLVVVSLVMGYFMIHGLGLGGGKGYLSLTPLNQEISQTQLELAELKEYRQWLEHRVFLVSEGEIDEDLLGEIARSKSGLFAPDEVIIDLN